MKTTMKKKGIIIFAVLVLFAGVLFAIFQTSSDKGVDGKWELVGICKNHELRFGNFGEYEYFNLNLSDDGVINIFSYPQKYEVLGTYAFIEKRNETYDYAANLYTHNEYGETVSFGAKFTYITNEKRLLLFFSEDDGLIFERTKELTTVKNTTTNNNQIQSNSNSIQNGAENMADFRSTCEEYVSSKNLVRYEQEYLNKNFCYIGQVFQYYSDDNVYKIVTDENFDGIYADNFIYAQDCRKNDKTKILEGDIITIYGTFKGVSTDNYPCFKFYYADIEDVQQSYIP